MRMFPLVFVALVLPQAPRAEPALAVEIIKVGLGASSYDYSLTGTIGAVDSYAAGFRDGGRVIEVAVDVGDRVTAGEVLARIDPATADAAFRSAEASLEAADAVLVQARQARDRAEGLLRAGNGTQADLDSATQAFLTAQSSRDQAGAQLATARRADEDTTLTALEDAVVTARDAEPGQVVGAGQSVVTLANRDRREAVFLTPNYAILDSFLGKPVDIASLDGTHRVTAPLSEIAPLVADNGTVTVKVALSGAAADQFTLGQPVTGSVVVAQPPQVVVPWMALSALGNSPAVWLVDPADMTVHLQPVKIASYDDAGMDISGGLKVGDLVVGRGAHLLYPGRKVKAVGEAGQ